MPMARLRSKKRWLEIKRARKHRKRKIITARRRAKSNAGKSKEANPVPKAKTSETPKGGTVKNRVDSGKPTIEGLFKRVPTKDVLIERSFGYAVRDNKGKELSSSQIRGLAKTTGLTEEEVRERLKKYYKK